MVISVDIRIRANLNILAAKIILNLSSLFALDHFFFFVLSSELYNRLRLVSLDIACHSRSKLYTLENYTLFFGRSPGFLVLRLCVVLMVAACSNVGTNTLFFMFSALCFVLLSRPDVL